MPVSCILPGPARFFHESTATAQSAVLWGRGGISAIMKKLLCIGKSPFGREGDCFLSVFYVRGDTFEIEQCQSKSK